jgi:hypothetical protein
MKEETRLISARARVASEKGQGLGSRISARFKGQGVELDLPRRDEKARVVDFGE